MEKKVAISVEHISKQFKIFYDKSTSLKEKVLFQHRRKYEEREVLRDVSFQIPKGQAVGLIGHNGCGKSTMLKLLTKIMYPEQGQIVTDGRISALIELGAGFHPDMSGRENIYTNAAIFGLSRQEIDQRLEQIIEFSELGKYIDNPVRTYSSGMYMRLAFSVAINVDADILLVDEILAVGDASFQAKCFNRLREIKANGTTIVIVSHSLAQIEQICDRSIWIHEGKIRADGLPREIHPAYLDYMAKEYMEHTETEQEAHSPQEDDTTQEPEDEETSEQEKTRWGNRAAYFTQIRLLNGAGQETSRFVTGEPMTIEMGYRVKSSLKHPACGIGIFRNDGVQCYGVNTQIDHIQGLELQPEGVLRFQVESNVLLPGIYTLDVALHTEDGFAYDYYRFAKEFQVSSQRSEAGIARLPHTWVLDGKTLK